MGASVDEADFRSALGHFATGVTVVTARDGQERPRAITVSSFASVSLAPPLVLYCLGKSAFHFDAFAAAEAFAVNLLGAEAQGLSDRFAREAEDDFQGVEVSASATGCPVLPGCLAVLDCAREAMHDAGDHLIVVGRVTALAVPGGEEPLIYYRGRYRRLMP